MMNPVLIFTVFVFMLTTVFILFWKKQNKQLELLVHYLTDDDVPQSNALLIPSDLPAPVYRYLQKVLPKHAQSISQVRLTQSGKLRTSLTAQWLSFNAEQHVAPMTKGFVWQARVNLSVIGHVRVVDSYIRGVASGAVNLLSAFTVASAADVAELNSGALHRYLAEAVWYPTALLPQFGVVWIAQDDHTAVASLTDSGMTVSLEFKFNDADEVVAIYTSGRFGQFDGTYKKVPWEGHFSEYQRDNGFLLPRQAEVGWYDGDKLKLVWQGRIKQISFN